MRNYVISFLVLLTVNQAQLFSQRRWKWISPYPHSHGLVSSCVADHYVYFWGEPETVIATPDGGESFIYYAPFTDIDDVGLGQNYRQHIAFADSMTGIVFSTGGGVFRTTNGGATWSQIYGNSYHFSMTTFADSGVGWMLGSPGAYRTTDAGLNWRSFWNQQLFQKGSFSRIYALDNKRLWILKSFYYQAGGSIYYSSDGGETWIEQNSGVVSDTLNQVSYYDLKVRDSGIGFVIGSIYKPDMDTTVAFILQTSDFGDGWIYKKVNDKNLVDLISINDSTWIIYGNHPSTGPFSNDNKTFQLRSQDQGQTWTRTEEVFSNNHNYNYYYTSVFLPSLNTILASTINGIYKSIDSGLSYFRLTNETDIPIEDFAVDKNSSGEQQIAAAISTGNQYLLSTDGGRDWIKKALPSSVGSSITNLSVAGGTIFFVLDGNSIYKSEDLGNSWDKILASHSGYLRNADGYDKDNIAVEAYKRTWKLLYSSDGGINWTAAPYDDRFRFNSLQILKPGEVVACGAFYDTSGTKGLIFKATDYGFNWRAIDLPREMLHIHMVNDHTGFAHSLYELYRTIDSGKTWILRLSSNDYYTYYSNFCFRDSLNGLMRVSWYFLESDNAGSSWHKSNLNLPLWGSLKRMAYNKYGDLLVLGESQGFLIYIDGQNSMNNSNIMKNSESDPVFNLTQNFPNPFNSTTSIKFYMNKDINIKLIIYDILGQKVRTLFNGSLKSGDYSVSWDGVDDNGNVVASGLYIYRIHAGNFVQSKKMLFLK